MLNGPIPQWALDRADDVESEFFREWDGCRTYPDWLEDALELRTYAAVALASYIASHEQPPVDPDVIAVREIAKAFCGEGTVWDVNVEHDDIDRGCYDRSPIFAAVLETLRKHKEAGE